jgi:hypothetical protein
MYYDGDGTKDLTLLCGGAWNFHNDDGSFLKSMWISGVGQPCSTPPRSRQDGW